MTRSTPAQKVSDSSKRKRKYEPSAPMMRARPCAKLGLGLGLGVGVGVGVGLGLGLGLGFGFGLRLGFGFGPPGPSPRPLGVRWPPRCLVRVRVRVS